MEKKTVRRRPKASSEAVKSQRRVKRREGSARLRKVRQQTAVITPATAVKMMP